jgi:putative membrane protein insertion efficiency factor
MGHDNCHFDPRARRVDGRSAGAWVLLFLARFYITFLSPFFGGSCKFYPSCSKYAFEAIATHGARRGFVLAMKRLLRCRPFTKGGFDPVPDSDLTRAAGFVPEGAAIAHRDLPTLGCLGRPFAATPGLRDLRAGNKEETAQ